MNVKGVLKLMSEVTYLAEDSPHWIKITKHNKTKYMCSGCRNLATLGAEGPSADIGERKYCPNCGVKMEYIKL